MVISYFIIATQSLKILPIDVKLDLSSMAYLCFICPYFFMAVPCLKENDVKKTEKESRVFGRKLRVCSQLMLSSLFWLKILFLPISS